MATFAVLSGDTVSNTIVADSLEIAELVTNAECVEYTTDNPAGIGWNYDRKTAKFVAPTVDPTPAS
jgi:hypothetical protein